MFLLDGTSFQILRNWLRRVLLCKTVTWLCWSTHSSSTHTGTKGVMWAAMQQNEPKYVLLNKAAPSYTHTHTHTQRCDNSTIDLREKKLHPSTHSCDNYAPEHDSTMDCILQLCEIVSVSKGRDSSRTAVENFCDCHPVTSFPDFFPFR